MRNKHSSTLSKAKAYDAHISKIHRDDQTERAVLRLKLFEVLDQGQKVPIKELAMSLWGYVRRGWAEKAWKRWMSRACLFHLEPMTRVARMVGRHLDGILNAVVKKVTNAGAEGLNSKIQLIKKNARGFRNRERFKNAIYFYCGGLALYPDSLYLAEG